MSDGIFLQDREILFDMSKNKSELQRGEQLFQRQEHIEDFKGNPGESGTMAVTNMRLIWYSRQDPKINLSLGYDCVSQVEVKNQYSQMHGNQQTLLIKAKFKTSRFEFIFRSLIGDQPIVFRLFHTV